MILALGMNIVIWDRVYICFPVLLDMLLSCLAPPPCVYLELFQFCLNT